MIKGFSVTALGANNYPVKTVRVTLEQMGFEENDIDLEAIVQKIRKAKWGTPELQITGLIQAILHYGMRHVSHQMKRQRLSTFLKNRRG